MPSVIQGRTMALVADCVRTSTTIRRCDDEKSIMTVVAKCVTKVQKVPQEGFIQQRMDEQVNKPNGTEELSVSSLSAIGCLCGGWGVPCALLIIHSLCV